MYLLSGFVIRQHYHCYFFMLLTMENFLSIIYEGKKRNENKMLTTIGASMQQVNTCALPCTTKSVNKHTTRDFRICVSGFVPKKVQAFLI